ncbi:hypothetical protein BS78_02G054600 [Paspalum vaginatum]|nr:hypothetical protein BS78_02G054600 [Paspalum vaginatum]
MAGGGRVRVRRVERERHRRGRGVVAGGTTRAAAPGVRIGGSGDAGAGAVGGGTRVHGGVRREPNRGCVRAYEQSLLNYVDGESNIAINPAVGMLFNTPAEAYEFYNLHSWELGFGIRCNKNEDKNAVTQEIVCCCEGTPELSNTASVQTDCKAMVRITRSDGNGWYIQELRGDHNHPLSGVCSEQLSWPSHEHLKPYAKILVRRLRDDNVDISKKRYIVYTYFGFMENDMFEKRDLKSLCQWIALDLSEIDASKVGELFHDFSSLRRDDPSFMFRIELDDIDQFNTVLWTNGRSRMHYAHFGDAITFDTTHRTDLYGIHFGLFVGANNHHQSIILGGALMRHKTVESFKWLFREFITLMGGKAPSTILTDQCHEMEVAIQEELPETLHGWCKMHVLSEENEFLGPICSEKTGFKDEFHKISDSMLTDREFESAWQHLLDKYNLHGNEFLSQIYDSRHKWAKPYFKGKFCAKQTSTQTNESANHMFKGYVPQNRSINMSVRYYNKLQSDIHSKEIYEENRSAMSPRVVSKGIAMKEHAAKIYTRVMFEKFDEIVSQSASYVVHEKAKGKSYLARQIRSNCPESWSQVEFEVTIRPEDGTVICECGLWEHMGMPCCHAVKVMMHLGMQEIPLGNIVKRWTVEARDILPDCQIQCENDRAAEDSMLFKQSEMFVLAMEVAEKGSTSYETFEIVMAHLSQLEQELLEHRAVDGVSGLSEQSSLCAAQGPDVQGMSAATTDDATSAGLEHADTVAPGQKRKIVQHMPGKGPQ